MTRHTRIFITALVVVAAVASLWPADLFAQRATRRSPSRSRVVVVSRPYYYSPFYYSRFYYPGFYGYGSFYDPYFWYGYGQYPYPYGYPPYYGRWAYDNTGAAQLKVHPRNAKVYVDGYFAGEVDDFDGTFQRLNVEAGEHELQLYLEGYQSYTQKVLFVRGRTLKLTHTLLPLGPGESAGPPPQPDPSTVRTRTDENINVRRAPQGAPRYPNRGSQSEFGSLLLRVRPQDAEVIVDGQSWDAPQGEDQIVIELAEGTHRIEVRKDGFQTYSTTVQVRRGQTVRLNVGLTAGRPGEV